MKKYKKCLVGCGGCSKFGNFIPFVEFYEQLLHDGCKLLDSVVLNSVISFYLTKSMYKYCMMVVNYSSYDPKTKISIKLICDLGN